ncbi:MAG: DEAD/DEAH box helicase, partial [Archangium sp.]|nr:DEAD/DEAH box helicase [Archangium sp.]
MSDAVQLVVEGLQPGRRVRTVGLSGAARAWVLSRLHRQTKRPLICVTSDEDAADKLAADLAFFLGGAGSALEPNVVRLPADEVLPWDELVPDSAVVGDRLGALFHLSQGTRFAALVLSARALVKRVMPPATMTSLSCVVRADQDHGRDALARRLADMGYRNAPLVEDSGTFSARGDILDVWPALHDAPVRLEFFGDTIESMRAFDPDTQRTSEPVTSLTLAPARELLLNDATKKAAEASVREAAEAQHVPTSKVRERLEQIREGLAVAGLESLLPGFFPGGLASVFDYLRPWANNAVVWVDEPAAQSQLLDELYVDISRSHADAVDRAELTLGPEAHFLTRESMEAALAELAVVEGGGLSLDSGRADDEAPIRFELPQTKELREAIRAHHGEEGALAPLVERLERWRDESYAVVVGCGTAGQVDRLKRLLTDRNVATRAHEEPLGDPTTLRDPAIRAHLFVGEVSAGFIDAAAHVAVLSDEDIFGARARRKVRRRKSDGAGFAASFQDLKEGDLCVHAEFGVCRYAGLVAMQVNGVAADFLILDFAGRDKIYLPVNRMRLISRFTGGDPSKITLDKLGTNSWEKKKAFVKEQLLKMAAELLQLYAQRKAHPGHAFSSPDRYFRQFEADFEFEETPDQLKAIEAVIADMQKPEPMDRLVCGDVGYGKTEVAMRAAFKAVLDRKQVAVLVPTTLLAHQHFNTFRKRFDGYPVTIEVVSSLKKASEVRDIVRRAHEGRCDVIIGTHKLLTSEV